jgi:hypothetical protein
MLNRIPLILSALALTVALTGVGAQAAGVFDGSQIMNGTIGVAKLTPKAIKQLHGLKGERGPRGVAGIDGANGIAGAPGQIGAAGAAGGFNPAKVMYVTGPTISLPPYPSVGYTATAIASCPAGTKAIGGGFFASINNIGASLATPDGSSWGVILQNMTTISTTANAYAVCAAP